MERFPIPSDSDIPGSDTENANDDTPVAQQPAGYELPTSVTIPAGDASNSGSSRLQQRQVQNQGHHRRVQSDVTWTTDTLIANLNNSQHKSSLVKVKQPSGSTSTPQSQATTVIVNSSMIQKRHSQNFKTPVGLQDMVHVLRADNQTLQINMEQIRRVRHVHELFSKACYFSFNYNTLLLVASVLAGLGLVSDSSATVIASMLVSPIMGPVVGIAYGATIQDWRLCRRALATEIGSLLVCIVVGVAIGACTGATGLGKKWPTSEMVARANMENLLVALPVAFFSGLAVAVGLLDDQMSSLVGVAISASLLPPAVNSGILWVAFLFLENDWIGSVPDPAPLGLQSYKFVDEDDPTKHTHKDFRNGGLVSLSLTMSNIVLIVISSMLMFRLKERLPVEKAEFWHDLGVARKIYRRLALMPVEEELEDGADDDMVLQQENNNAEPDLDV